MKRALVVAGGTGSTNLQIGLHGAGIQYELLINAYDDGKSTGFVRRIAKCLGPSDIRKNLHTMLGIRDQRSPYLSTLGCRFNAPGPRKAEEFCFQRCALTEAMVAGIKHWFEIAPETPYRDVSVVNLALAGLAGRCGSMQAAADELARSIGLPPVVHLSSDENLDLFAVSRSGVVAPEGRIVEWGDVADPLERLEFARGGEPTCPPVLSGRAAMAMHRADMIIIAPGTLFSSILPTLLTTGFVQAAEGKPVVVIENLTMDADVAGHEPEQALGMILDALQGCHIYLIPRTLSRGEYHDPQQLIRSIAECLN